MQTEMQHADIKAKIAELRQRYGRLKAICGPQGINQETIADYAKRLEQLQKQLN